MSRPNCIFRRRSKAAGVSQHRWTEHHLLPVPVRVICTNIKHGGGGDLRVAVERQMRLTFLVLALALISYAVSDDLQEVGAILSVRGDWRVPGKQNKLLAGQAVPANTLIQNRAVQAGDSIAIVLLNGEKLELDCRDDLSGCAKGITTPPSAVKGLLSVRGVIKAVQQVLLDREPEVAHALSHTISRGSRAVVGEAIVAYSPENRIRIAEYLDPLPSDVDIVELQKNEGHGQRSSVKRVTPQRPDGVVIALSAPGSYVANVIREDNEVALNLFILAVPPATEEQLKAKFEHARKLTSAWDPSGDPDLVHKFLRAYLLSLAPG